MSFKIAMSGRAPGRRRASSEVYLLVNLLKNMSIMPLGVFLVCIRFKGTGYNSLIFCQGRQLLKLRVSFTAHQAPSENESTLKGKNLLPLGANSFLLK